MLGHGNVKLSVGYDDSGIIINHQGSKRYSIGKLMNLRMAGPRPFHFFQFKIQEQR